MDPAELRAELPVAAARLAPYARMLASSEHDAADLLQDTVVRALERAAAFDGRSSLATWLRRIMHNLWVDRVRAAREDPREDIAELVEARWRDDDYTVDASVVVARAEERDDLLDALAHMPAMYRTAVVLHDAQGLTSAEVAETMDVAVPAAKQRIRRGRMMLVTHLADAAAAPIRTGVPMRCWQARSQVSDYLDGDLDAEGVRALESHLAGCRTCPPLYASLVATRTAIRAEPDPDSVVPPELAARIASLLDRPAPAPAAGARPGDYRAPMPDPELVVCRVNDTSYVATLGGVEVGWASVAVSDGVWEVYRTVTAPAYEGQGIASRLTRFVLEAAEEAGVTVIPSCWYVDGLMARSSPRYDHLRAGLRPPAEGEGDSCRIAPAVLPPGSTGS